MAHVPGPDGFMYDVDKILAVTPIPPELRHADVFLSYASEDRSTVDTLSLELERAGRTVWYDRDFVGGQQYRSVIEQRISGVKAVVVIWTEHSIGSRWVIDEAQRAHDAGKLVCLRHPSLDRKRIPAPFSSNDHIIELGDKAGLQVALDRLRVPKT